MYEVQVQVRGPEGVMAFTTPAFRTTKAGADAIVKKIADKVPFDQLLVGIEPEASSNSAGLVK